MTVLGSVGNGLLDTAFSQLQVVIIPCSTPHALKSSSCILFFFSISSSASSFVFLFLLPGH
jgi:hypothetical protein